MLEQRETQLLWGPQLKRTKRRVSADTGTRLPRQPAHRVSRAVPRLPGHPARFSKHCVLKPAGSVLLPSKENPAPKNDISSKSFPRSRAIQPLAEARCRQPFCEPRRHTSPTAALLRPLAQAGEGPLPPASLTLCHDAHPIPVGKMRSVHQHRGIPCSF